MRALLAGLSLLLFPTAHTSTAHQPVAIEPNDYQAVERVQSFSRQIAPLALIDKSLEAPSFEAKGFRAPASDEPIKCYSANDRTYICNHDILVTCVGRIGERCTLMQPNLKFNYSVDPRAFIQVDFGDWEALEEYFADYHDQKAARSPATKQK